MRHYALHRFPKISKSSRNGTLKHEGLDRRTILKGAGSALCLALLPISTEHAGAVLPLSPVDLSFSVLHRGERIGYHRVSMTREGARMRIQTRVDALVKFAFFTAFEYHHESVELWDDVGLLTLTSKTDDQGKSYSVRGVRLKDAFRVVGPSGPYLAPRTALTTDSIWTYAMVSQKVLIDVKRGGVIGVNVQAEGDETIEVTGQPRPTRRYRVITPYFAGSLWYDSNGEWVQGALERDGELIEFRRA